MTVAARRPLSLLVILSALLGSLVGYSPARADAFTVGTAGRVNAHEASMLYYVNSARKSYGLAALIAVPGTTDVARRWSATMAGSARLYHNPNLVSQVAGAGAGGWTAMAENVGYASACDVKQLFNAYMASPGHRANILDRSMRYIGIGTYERPMSGWPCGQAWNTMDFVNYYTSSYGPSRNPPQGMQIEATTLTSSRSFASFESGVDPRAITSVVGLGIATSLPVFETPTAADNALHWSVAQRYWSTGYAQLRLRDAVNLRYTRQLSITVKAVTPTGRPVAIGVQLAQDWGRAASLGTVMADGTARTYTFTVPLAVQAFDNNLRLSVTNSALSMLSSYTSQRKAGIYVYDVQLIV